MIPISVTFENSAGHWETYSGDKIHRITSVGVIFKFGNHTLNLIPWNRIKRVEFDENETDPIIPESWRN